MIDVYYYDVLLTEKFNHTFIYCRIFVNLQKNIGVQ